MYVSTPFILHLNTIAMRTRCIASNTERCFMHTGKVYALTGLSCAMAFMAVLSLQVACLFFQLCFQFYNPAIPPEIRLLTAPFFGSCPCFAFLRLVDVSNILAIRPLCFRFIRTSFDRWRNNFVAVRVSSC